jgi:two-component system, NarL family, nitrate/nitrite response regulator NarL
VLSIVGNAGRVWGEEQGLEMNPETNCSGNGGEGRSFLNAGHRIRVLIADDHPVARRGMHAWLEVHSHLEVVGEAVDGAEALRKARELLPDVLLTDIVMPGMTGLEVAEVLHQEMPEIRVVLLSMYANPSFVLRCRQSGAHGYVLKQADADEVIKAIESVNAGHSYFSPYVARMALEQLVPGNRQGPALGALTDREREVLTGIGEGLRDKDIARRLNMGVRTVETHRMRLTRKLNIYSIAGLTRFAIANGLVNMPDMAA